MIFIDRNEVRDVKKRRIILYFFLVLLFIISVITILCIRNHIKETVKIEEVRNDDVKDSSNTIEEEIEQSYLFGSDVIDAYKKVEGKDYAFLVATQSLLETDIFDLMNLPEYNYRVYVLSSSDFNIVDTILSKNGLQVNMVFINYNCVINDTCLLKKSSGLFYETRADFRVDESSNKIFYEMNEKGTFKIDEKAEFIVREIYNANGEIIGCTYIEQ